MEEFREHWKIYIPSWVFPFLAIGKTLYEDSVGEESFFVNLSVSLCFLSAGACVANPYLKGKVRLAEAFVFWALLPFLAWVILVQLRLLYAAT